MYDSLNKINDNDLKKSMLGKFVRFLGCQKKRSDLVASAALNNVWLDHHDIDLALESLVESIDTEMERGEINDE